MTAVLMLLAAIFQGDGNRLSTRVFAETDPSYFNIEISPERTDWGKGEIPVVINVKYPYGSDLLGFEYMISQEAAIPSDETMRAEAVFTSDQSAEFCVAAEGVWYLFVRVYNIDGTNSGTGRYGPYRYDCTGPVLTWKIIPSDWTRNGVVFSAKATDPDGAGVSRILTPEGRWSWYTAFSCSIYKNGVYHIGAQDHAGNFTFEDVYITNIDNSVPKGVFEPESGLLTEGDTGVVFRVTDAGASGLFYWRYRVSEDGGVSWGAWSENFTEYSGEVELEGTGPWMVHSDILNRAGTHGDVYSGEYLKEDKKASISNLQIISIADPRWIKYYREIRYKDTEIYCRRQPYDLMSGLPDGMSRPEGSLFPISRNRDYNGIALGYKLEFDIDTEGLQDPEDVLYVDTCFYALDRKGGLHEADVYAKNEYGRYVNLYETWFCGSSGRVTLVNERFAGQYRDAPDNIKMNTWRFSYYLPGNAVVTDKGESFDPINSKSHDYKLLVAFSIYTLTDEGKKIYYMEAGEEEQQTEWIPVFWYNLYESVFNDIVAHRVSG